MNLFTRLQAHHQAGKSIPIAMIGAGKFATMFLAQLRKLPAIHLACLVDLNPKTAKQNLHWQAGQKIALPRQQLTAP